MVVGRESIDIGECMLSGLAMIGDLDGEHCKGRKGTRDRVHGWVVVVVALAPQPMTLLYKSAPSSHSSHCRPVPLKFRCGTA